jgi:hypothetical protein
VAGVARGAIPYNSARSTACVASWSFFLDRRWSDPMSDMALFLITEAIVLVVSVGVTLFMRRHLRNVLTDLTGTPERAAFWSAFTSLLLVLVPLMVVMFVPRDTGSDEPVFFRVVAQLRWALVGLVATLVSYGFIIIWFVQTQPRRP